jgi:HTH-type transcriptional regulator / antitoxin HipB
VVGSITGRIGEEGVMCSRRSDVGGRAGRRAGEGHVSYEEVAADRRASAEYREGYDEARRVFEIGQAVRERRLALGLSQTELATRAGMTQPALSRLEAGGSVPRIPVLERIATALGAELVVALSPPAA